MKIGVLGGTFDPIHIGHLAAARAAMECENLDRILFIPTGLPPHRDRAVAGDKDRLEMARLATAEDQRWQVCDIEARRGGTSYTVDTLKELKQLYPGDRLFLILGWDAAKLFNTWRDPAEIRKVATVIVVTRPGSGPLTGMGLEAAGLGQGDLVCERHTPDVSASEVRAAIGRGESVRQWLPEPVEAYIARNGLYRHNRQVGC